MADKQITLPKTADGHSIAPGDRLWTYVESRKAWTPVTIVAVGDDGLDAGQSVAFSGNGTRYQTDAHLYVNPPWTSLDGLKDEAVQAITACDENRLSKQELIDKIKELLDQALMLGDKCDECYQNGWNDALGLLAWHEPGYVAQ